MALLTFQDICDTCITTASNKEQNAMIPPIVVTSSVNLLSDWILNALVNIFPNSQLIFDKARPFLYTRVVPIKNGEITVPGDYRNLLEVSIAVDQNYNGGCSCQEECEKGETKVCATDEELEDLCNPDSPLFNPEKAKLPKQICKYQPVKIVDSDQFADATMSDLYPPSYKVPVGVWLDVNRIKICPTELTHAKLVYVMQPKKYNMTTILMPDDTWQINTADPLYVPLQWERNVAPEFFRGISTILGVHTRDGNLNQALNELKKAGIF